MGSKTHAELRAAAIIGRNTYTDVLKAHGVSGKGYMLCTDGVYYHTVGGRAWQIRAANDLHPKANLRDHLGILALSKVLMAEAVASRRIEIEMCIGNEACLAVTVTCAKQVAKSIDSIIGEDD